MSFLHSLEGFTDMELYYAGPGELWAGEAPIVEFYPINSFI